MREQWLIDATKEVGELLREKGFEPKPIWISVGLPKGRGGKGKVVGQCWDNTLSTDKQHHVFIHPCLKDPVEVLAVILHELIHASVGIEHKHRGKFARAMKEVGMEKPYTTSTPGEDLKPLLKKIAKSLGEYKHAAMDPKMLKPKDKGRNRKFQCPCGQKIWASRDEVDATCSLCEKPYVIVTKLGEPITPEELEESHWSEEN